MSLKISDKYLLRNYNFYNNDFVLNIVLHLAIKLYDHISSKFATKWSSSGSESYINPANGHEVMNSVTDGVLLNVF